MGLSFKGGSNSRSKLPSRKKIKEYWIQILCKMGIYIADDDACFACGKDNRFQLQRCHILPVNYGGTDTIDNLHILCKSCHTDSEPLYHKRYWNWLRNVNNNEYKLSFSHIMELNNKTGINTNEIIKRIMSKKKINTNNLTYEQEQYIAKLVIRYAEFLNSGCFGWKEEIPKI